MLTPVSVIPDVDSDGVQDLMIFIATGDKVRPAEAVTNPVSRPQEMAGTLVISILQPKRKRPGASDFCGLGAGSFPPCRDSAKWFMGCFFKKAESQAGVPPPFQPGPLTACSWAAWRASLGQMSLQFSGTLLREVEGNKP